MSLRHFLQIRDPDHTIAKHFAKPYDKILITALISNMEAALSELHRALDM